MTATAAKWTELPWQCLQATSWPRGTSVWLPRTDQWDRDWKLETAGLYTDHLHNV